MAVQRVKEPNQETFMTAVVNRQRVRPNQRLTDIVSDLIQYYDTLDKSARMAFINNAVRMYNNYENRWLGTSVNGEWREETAQGTNNVYFTVPLLTAHVDTHITAYTKVRPKYAAKPYVDTQLNRRLAEMCEQVGTSELARMLKPSLLQKEGLYISLTGVSYRNIVVDIQNDSPTVVEEFTENQEIAVDQYRCKDCGSEFEAEENTPVQCQSESCMSDNVEPLGQATKQVATTNQRRVPLPRPKIEIPNPISIQDDFSAASFADSRFLLTRRKISKREAEFYYQIDLTSANDTSGQEANTVYDQARTAIGKQGEHQANYTFSAYSTIQNEQVEEIKMWLMPCEYGLYFADGDLLVSKFPYGMMLHIVGDVLVGARPARLLGEWIRTQHGVRPSSNKGSGLAHLADLNDAVNNAISLDYSILRTHGFPIRLLRGKWLSSLPQATQTLIMEKIPDDRSLAEAVHTEQASNTSGLLGVTTQKFMSFMQYVGGSLEPTGLPSDTRDVMGSATGAAAVQEMMTTRMGLPIQMRVEADIDTIFSVLRILQEDERNRQYFIDGGYDQTVVDAFFEADFRSVFYLEPVRGSDEPRMDSVNTFKVQSFASLVASLTGLRQFDRDSFYDIVAALGDTLNIDVSVGAGRSERNLADNRVARIIELYRDQKDLPEKLNIDPVEFGVYLFQAVTMKEKAWMEAVIRSSLPAAPEGATPEQQLEMMAQAQATAANVEVNLFDYAALCETYSDWLQSDLGQNSDLPVVIAVGMLYNYCQEQVYRKEQMEKQAQMEQALLMMAGKESTKSSSKDDDDNKADNPPGALKRDGSSGPGRPKDVKIDKPSE